MSRKSIIAKNVETTLCKDTQVADVWCMMHHKRAILYKTKDYPLIFPSNSVYLGVYGYTISVSTFDSCNLIYIEKKGNKSATEV
jgi:hypothetical protein